MWWWAFRNLGPARNQVRDVLIVVGFALLLAASSGAWVAWNVSLWRRGERRVAPVSAGHDYGTDVAGRPVEADFTALASARYVVVSVVERDGRDVKQYEMPPNQEPSEEEVAACPI